MVLAVSGIVSARATDATAAPRTVVVLEYEVAPDASGCPSEEEFRASVARQLRYDPFLAKADRRVAVHIATKESGYASWIRWSDAQGHWVGDRRLSSQRPECTEIAVSTAFAVAVQIQLLTELSPESAEPSESSSAPAAPSSSAQKPEGTTPAPPAKDSRVMETPPIPPAVPRAARRVRLGLSAGLGASLALGVEPHATGSGRIFGTGRLDWFSFELALDGALPAARTEPDGSGFSVNRFGGEAAACGNVWSFAACLTTTVGRIQARGFGVDRPASPSGVFSQAGARLAARQDFGDRFFASVRVEGLLTLSPWTVTLNDSVAWTTPRVGGLAGIDFGIAIF